MEESSGSVSAMATSCQTRAMAAAARAAAALLALAVVGGSDHSYKAGEPVPLYANMVGPFHNPRDSKALGFVGYWRPFEEASSNQNFKILRQAQSFRMGA